MTKESLDLQVMLQINEILQNHCKVYVMERKAKFIISSEAISFLVQVK